MFRCLSYIVLLALLVGSCAEVSHALLIPGELVVYVGDRPYPSDFDPYYNEPKIYRQPRYYTSTSKKYKGKKVFKTTRSRTNTVGPFTRRPPLTKRKKRSSSHS